MSNCVIVAIVATALVTEGVTASSGNNPGPGLSGDLRASPGVGALAHAASCFEVYSNVAIPSGFYFPAGAGVEVLDDLHLRAAAVGDVCAIDIGYFKGGPGTTDAVVRFYTGTVDDDPPGAALTTSFPLLGLPSGESSFHVELPSESIAREVWLGVSFSTADAGLLLAHPPWPGASDDFFYMNAPGNYFTFGGNPASNFLLGVYATGTPVTDVTPEPGRPVQRGFLAAPAPNPTLRGVDLRFGVQEGGRVQIQVLDAAGRIVARLKDEVLQPGTYSAFWDGGTAGGDRAAPGVYLVRLVMPRFAGTRKIVLMN